MKYSIRKIPKKVGEQFQDVICVCVCDDKAVSVIAEIHDYGICEEHRTPEFWAEKIVSALNMQSFVDSVAV
jgi:hypothetical protein